MIQVQVKLRLRPAQERHLERVLWKLTGAWNWAIRKIEADARAGIYYSAFDMNTLVSGHGARSGVPQQALGGIVAQAVEAWRRCRSGRAKRPRLKGRRNKLNSIPVTHGREFRVIGSTVNLPGIARVRFHKQAIPEGRVRAGRIIRRPSGWYACLFIDAEPRQIPQVSHFAIGIDPGFSNLLTTSAGEVIEHPQELRAGALSLARAQRGRSKRLTARLHERIANRRKDRNHKLSRLLVSENAVILWSKDRTLAIQRSFGKSVTSAGHHQLRNFLSYKCRAGGRQFIAVDSRNSTRICSACGAKSGPSGYAGLRVRQWGCACGAQHDRDVNAAINTLLAGLGMSLEGGREAASGIASIRTPRDSSPPEDASTPPERKEP